MIARITAISFAALVALSGSAFAADTAGSQAAAPAPTAATAPAEVMPQITAADFDQKLQSYDGVIVMDVFATWCGPCKMYAPILEGVAGDYKSDTGVEFVRIIGDAPENATLAGKIGIQAFPTTVFFQKDGNGVWHFGTLTGVRDAATLHMVIDRIKAGTLPLRSTLN